MIQDATHAITNAEKTIEGRSAAREAMEPEVRSAVAIELIADELTRLHAEARTLRYLLATYLARSSL
jgi:hypothetical protein